MARFNSPGFFGVVSSIALVASIAALAQTPASPTFEVASVKPNNTGPFGPTWFNNERGGLLTRINNPLILLIREAYNVPQDQIVGPDWIRTARFDVLAKTGGDGFPEFDGQNSVRPMWRALLAERFKLVVHLETKLVPKYALVMARSDHKLGPQLKPSDTECTPVDVTSAIKRGAPAPSGSCGFSISAGSLIGNSVTMSEIAGYLVGRAGRDVIDRTGLAGPFNFMLDLDPSVSIFTTVDEQLGLKLEPVNVPSDVVVVDHIERPTAN